MHMHAYLLIIFIPVPIITMMVMAYALRRTVEGHEDETGFHASTSGAPVMPPPPALNSTY